MMEWVEVVASSAGRMVEDEWPSPSSWPPSAAGTCVGDDPSEALVSEREEDVWVTDEAEETTEAELVLLSAGAAHTSLYSRKKVNASPQDSDDAFPEVVDDRSKSGDGEAVRDSLDTDHKSKNALEPYATTWPHVPESRTPSAFV